MIDGGLLGAMLGSQIGMQQAQMQAQQTSNVEAQKQARDSLYWNTYMGLQNAYKAPKIFPRCKEFKEQRMDKFVEWKRRKIKERHMHTIGIVMAWACLPPLALLVIGFCWRTFIWLIVQ